MDFQGNTGKHLRYVTNEMRAIKLSYAGRVIFHSLLKTGWALVVGNTHASRLHELCFYVVSIDVSIRPVTYI